MMKQVKSENTNRMADETLDIVSNLHQWY